MKHFITGRPEGTRAAAAVVAAAVLVGVALAASVAAADSVSVKGREVPAVSSAIATSDAGVTQPGTLDWQRDWLAVSAADVSAVSLSTQHDALAALRASVGEAENTQSSSERSASAESAGDDSLSVLVVRRAVGVSGCGERFVTPGEQLSFATAGFKAGTTVSSTARAVSLGGASTASVDVADRTADADGALEFSWTVPNAPTALVDAAPRAYAIQATGNNPDGGAHTAYMIEPVVAYPATVPCAAADTADATLGQPASISVLDNDVAPTGGVLDASSVEVRAAVGGRFAADTTSGMVTFTPDAGFWGTVETSYAVFDGWGVGVRAGLTVTVDPGCTVTGTAGVELIEGTEGADVICVADREDWEAFHVIDAKGGDDVILGGAGVEWIYGGDGADVIFGNGGDDRIVAGSWIDTVYGGPGMDSVYSVDLADTVIDDGYELILSRTVTVAQSGPVLVDDWAWADVSATVQVDVLGNDHDPNEDLDPATLRVSAVPSSGTAEVTQDAQGRAAVEFAAGAAGGSVSFSYGTCDSLGTCAEADVTVMVGTADCTIVGTGGGDVLRGTPGDDVICGLGGDDHIVGLGGHDVIVGGPGHDLVYADVPGDGSVGGDDIVWGGPGDDTLLGGGGADRMWGGLGDDSVYGESGGDALVGGPGADTVSGGFGDDRLWGNAGGDKLYGFEDDDALWGGVGADVVWGGPGDDVLWGGADDDEMRGGPGADRIRAGPGDDEAAGQAGADAIWGGPGDDVLRGGPGDDEIHGGPGEDTLHGDADDDRMWGGIDADTLDGGLGTDHLDGGAGADACRRSGTKAGCERA